MALETKLKLEYIVKSHNLVPDLSKQDLATIGDEVFNAWQTDKTSRAEWETKTENAMNLALQVMETKSFPWEGASNVKFPLVTIAALQYHSRAYPALISSPEVVKCRVIGGDPDGQKQARGDRVAAHMSYQILEEDECWEEEMDRVLITQPIVGCAFKKTWYDPVVGHNQSVNILARDFYIPYFAKSLEKASRLTEVLYYSKNDMYEKVAQEIFVDYDSENPPQDYDEGPLEQSKQAAQGITKPTDDPDRPYELLEQHTFLDLDGDGYKEPYIVTIRKDTKFVLRIVARFDSSSVKKKNGKVLCIVADQYYTKFPFIPSPDGGIYDIGFGVLLGPLNESINTSINQLIDAGTLSVTAGGFLGRGVKFRSGENSFKPFEWRRVDSTGDDLRKGVFPLPVREPSDVLFRLLGMLIDYGERIGMATDPQVGVSTGQNTPAETSRNMITEGQRIFSAIYKRTHRALKEEFRKWYKLNSYFLDETVNYYSDGMKGEQIALRDDYRASEKTIIPYSDPEMVSDEEKLRQAMILQEMAANSGGFNMYEVNLRALRAMKVPDIDKVLPPPGSPEAPKPQPDSKVVIASMKAASDKLDTVTKAQIQLAKMQQEQPVLMAKIAEMEASAIKLLSEAKGVETGHQIAAIQSSIALAKQQQEGNLKVMELLKGVAELKLAEEELDVKKKESKEASKTKE
jgi:chaperonin GroES